MRVAGVSESFERALDAILARVFVSEPDKSAMAVAYSGGLDSSVLLHLAREYAQKHGVRLHAFHVHHGLSPNADDWQAYCQREAAAMGVSFDTRRVNVDKNDSRGLEAAARAARYAALGEMCRRHDVPLLLLAQHQDDQVETVLLQMLRGAGLAGLSGMEEAGAAPELLGDAKPIIARPLLSIRRAALEAYAENFTLTHIEDESNQNLRHPRNALRQAVLPLLAQHFPSYRDCLARGAQHAQAAQSLLEDLAGQDLAAVQEGDDIDVLRLKELRPERIANLLRHWLARNGLRPPSAAWLHEARTQLLDARADAQVCVQLEGMALRRYRNRIVITRDQRDADNLAPLAFRWNGEASLPFPAFGGVLHFEPGDAGFSPDWLRTQSLRLQTRAGGGKLKLADNRRTRSLKDLYQERAIPAWERSRLPLVYAGKALLFAAGVGQDCQFPTAEGGIRLRWQAD